MKRDLKNTLQKFFFILFTASLWACGPPLIIPKSSKPTQTHKKYEKSYEVTWNAVISHLKTNSDIIIHEDKKSGTVTFKSSKSSPTAYLYANVYINQEPNDEYSTVFFRPWVAFPKSKRSAEIVSVRPAVSEETESIFFTGLDKTLREN